MKNIRGIFFIVSLLIANNLFSQVVINEVHMRPAGSSTSSNPQNLADCNPNSGAEFIELYNPDACVPADISCFIIANKIAGTSSSAQGAFRFPAGTVIPPLGFISIGGVNSGATFILNNYCGTNNLSTYTSGRWYLPNGDGYLMLYNSSGSPIDAVYWTTDGNAAKWGTDSDIDTNPTLIPSGDGGCPAVSSLSGPANLPISSAEHIGVASGAGLSSSRQTDGSLVWVSDAPNTINSCNSTCNVPTIFAVLANVNQPTCGNTDGNITLTPSLAGAYTYTWTPNVSSTNTASNLGAGSYQIEVSDGSCTWDTTITLTSPTPFTVLASVNQPTCGNTDGNITLTPNPAGAYTYTWTPNVSSINTASNLGAGSYQIEVSDGSCTWDTTITLTSPTPFTVLASVNQPTCGNTDGNITLTLNPAGVYTYTWIPNVSSSNFATNLADGNYQINVDDGSCTWDTTITLIPPICGCSDPLVLSVDSTPNTLCGGTSGCNYSGPSILINEINLVPSINDGSLYGETSLAGKEGEWIELYNPNWCDPVDISGYILGSYNGTGSLLAPASNGMGFVLPPGTIVPPLGFVIVRGRNAPVPPSSAIDIVVDNLGGNLCIDGGITTSRIWFQNTGGWFGFYDATGSPQDIVQWGTPTLASDLDGVPCIPSSSSVGSLVSANASGISYNLGATPATGQNYVRIPDGGSWSTITQNENSSYGTCNDLAGGCVIPSGGSSNCNGSATVNVVSGAAGPYSYQWDDPLNQTTATVDSLCPGIYNVTVTDASGDCVTSLSVQILDESEISFTSQVIQPSCSNDDGVIDLTPIVSESYTYSWSPNVSTTNSASNLSAGSYQIDVTNGLCSWDTTITLTSPTSFTVLATVNQPTCGNINGNIALTPSTGGTFTYTWTPNVSTTNSASNLSSGSYQVEVSNGSCTWDSLITITDSGILPIANFNYIITDSTCSIMGYTANTSINAINYTWNIDNQFTSNTSFIEFDFNDRDQHEIELIVSSEDGCTDSKEKVIVSEIFDVPVFIPNVFTPKNTDGMNDYWQVVSDSDCIEEFECIIFNRWGNKIYTMVNINDRWDGTYNGKEVPQGVYVYVLSIKNNLSRKITKHGHITKL